MDENDFVITNVRLCIILTLHGKDYHEIVTRRFAAAAGPDHPAAGSRGTLSDGAPGICHGGLDAFAAACAKRYGDNGRQFMPELSAAGRDRGHFGVSHGDVAGLGLRNADDDRDGSSARPCSVRSVGNILRWTGVRIACMVRHPVRGSGPDHYNNDDFFSDCAHADFPDDAKVGNSLAVDGVFCDQYVAGDVDDRGLGDGDTLQLVHLVSCAGDVPAYCAGAKYVNADAVALVDTVCRRGGCWRDSGGGTIAPEPMNVVPLHRGHYLSTGISVLPSLSWRASWPQAAAMSLPRLRRMCALIPAERRVV